MSETAGRIQRPTVSHHTHAIGDRARMATAYSTDSDRFSKLVKKTYSCWEWLGQISFNGYGVFWMKSFAWRAHRASWTLTNGPIPKGLLVLHRCDNRRCVRVDHLFLGTSQDNVDDMLQKGRERFLSGADLPGTKLTQQQVDEIRVRYAAGGIFQWQLAKEYGVSQSNISLIVSGDCTWIARDPSMKTGAVS